MSLNAEFGSDGYVIAPDLLDHAEVSQFCAMKS